MKYVHDLCRICICDFMYNSVLKGFKFLENKSFILSSFRVISIIMFIKKCSTRINKNNFN